MGQHAWISSVAKFLTGSLLRTFTNFLDNSPLKTLKGAEIFLKKNNDVNFFLFGKKELIENTINKHKIRLFNYKIENTQENVQNDDSPNEIINYGWQIS